MKPTIGRIVHYRGPGPANGQFQAKTYPAVIVTVHSSDCVNLFVMTDVGTMHINSCLRSNNPEDPSMWTWPPREETAAAHEDAAEVRGVIAKAGDVFSRKECIFNSCPHPKNCTQICGSPA